MGYINLNKQNFFSNIDYCTNILGNKNKICIALKDNAYGHGLEQIAQLSASYGIKHCMVRDLAEANIANRFNFESILILYEQPKPNQHYPSNFIFSINSLDNLAQIDTNINIELKIDTGMSRNGILVSQIKDSIKLIKDKNINLYGVFTHFCCADEDETITYKQEQLFISSIKQIEQLYKKQFRKHCANSAAIHIINNKQYDIARVGIALYGYIDIEQYSTNLKPILSLHANKISTRILHKGDCINYGATYKVPYDNFTVSNYNIGYSDGYFRLNERKKATISNGKNILGRVSMDSLSVEGDDETICIFDDVTKLATIHDTIKYEILTNLKSNIPRYII